MGESFNRIRLCCGRSWQTHLTHLGTPLLASGGFYPKIQRKHNLCCKALKVDLSKVLLCHPYIFDIKFIWLLPINHLMKKGGTLFNCEFNLYAKPGNFTSDVKGWLKILSKPPTLVGCHTRSFDSKRNTWIHIGKNTSTTRSSGGSSCCSSMQFITHVSIRSHTLDGWAC